MPIYEYRCPTCREMHELWQSRYDTDAYKCPECDVPMHKLISKSSFQLKGGGWYADGYCKKKKPDDAPSCVNDWNTGKPVCATCS